MMVQDIYLTKVEWHMRIYYCVTRIYADDILDDLISIGCSGSSLKEAKENLWNSKINTGLTYSNLDGHETVMVIGLASSPSEYYNSIEHEKLHVLQHISQAYSLDPFGEDICYICGEISKEMFKFSRKLLCECCLHKLWKTLS